MAERDPWLGQAGNLSAGACIGMKAGPGGSGVCLAVVWLEGRPDGERDSGPQERWLGTTDRCFHRICTVEFLSLHPTPHPLLSPHRTLLVAGPVLVKFGRLPVLGPDVLGTQ